MRNKYRLLMLVAITIVIVWACEKRESGVQPTACFEVSSENIYEGESVSFTNCSEEAKSYLWDFGDYTNSVLSDPVHKYDSKGEYLVVLIATNKDLQHQVEKTIKVIELPEGEISVRTYKVENVTTNSATVTGSVNFGGELIAKGVCWNTSPSPIVGANYTNEGTNIGDFSSEISSLDADTEYFVRAYATTNDGTTYGDELQFTTKINVVEPTVETLEVSDVTGSSAIVTCNISDNGGGNITKSGVCWATSRNPDTNGEHTTDGAKFGDYNSQIIGLMPNQTYFVRAYATNSAGTSYGENIEFTTLDVEPGTLIEVDPWLFSADQEIVIYFNAKHGDGGLAGYDGDVYAYSGLITENSAHGSDWKYVLVQDWLENQDKAKLERIGDDYYKFVISPSVNDYYGCPANERVFKMAFVFRSEDATRSGRMPDGSDFLIDVDRNTVFVSKTNQPPLIDGEVDDIWNSVHTRIVDVAWPDQYVSYDRSATFKALWDDENIYLLVDVPDDDFHPSVDANVSSWLADKPEIYLDVNDTKEDGGGPSGGGGHYQFGPAYNELENVSCIWAYSLDAAEEHYMVEYAIKLDSLVDVNGEKLNPTLRSEIGFDITLIDLDEPGLGINEEVGRVNWVNDVTNGESWITLDYSGNMIFME